MVVMETPMAEGNEKRLKVGKETSLSAMLIGIKQITAPRKPMMAASRAQFLSDLSGFTLDCWVFQKNKRSPTPIVANRIA